MDAEQLISTINKINENSEPVKRRESAKRRAKARQRKKAVSMVERTSMGKLIGFISLCVLLVFSLGAVIGYAVWYNSFDDIKLSDFTEVTLSGYNTHGSAAVEIGGEAKYSEFFRTVEASLDCENDLSNGDEITISYDFDEETAKNCKLRIDNAEAVVTVDGLTEPKIIDRDLLFSGVSVQFDGISPCIKVVVENTSDEQIVSDVVYAPAKEDAFYESGEDVEVIATLPEEYIDNPAYNVVLTDSDYVQTFTAPATDRYLSDPAQITDEILKELEYAGYDLISKADAKEYGLRIFQQEAHLKPVFVGNTTTFKWTSPYLISAYFHSVTEQGMTMVENHANDVQIVYGVTLTQQDGTSCLTEMVIQFVDLVEKQDGTIDLNLDSGRIVSASYRNSNIKRLVSSDSNGAYETTKLTE